MPYSLHWEPRGVYKQFSGFVAFTDYARSQERVLGDPRADDLRWIINDFLALDGYSVTTEDAEYSAAFNHGASISNPHIRVAYVTRDPKLLFLVQVASPFSRYPLRAFPSVEAAREWAGAEPVGSGHAASASGTAND